MKIGLIINPIAGMGGKAGLKGTDGAEVLAQAISLGAKRESASRTEQVLLPLARLNRRFSIMTCSGEMGEDTCKKLGITPKLIIEVTIGNTTRSDTIKAVHKLVESRVALILFSGGDGTACDILTALPQEIPILGIPAGVKMHSAVFGTSPSAVATLVSRIIKKGSAQFPVRSAEIMDLDEDLRRHDEIRTKLMGYATIPSDRFLMQNPKSYAITDDELSIAGISEYLVEHLDSTATYIVGPGRTTQKFLERIGVSGTLLGIDILRGEELIGRDVNHRQLEELSDDNSLYIITGIIGGQGFLFGRGNQQITPLVIRRVQKQNILVIASPEKISSLERQRLLIDTGDKNLDSELTGYIKVRANKYQAFILKVEAA